MAKLSARGRREFLRVSMERDIPNDDLIVWERITKVYMSDRTRLEKRSVRFKPDQFDSKGRLHDWGWKVSGKLKADYDLTEWVAKLRNDSRYKVEVLIPSMLKAS